MADGKRTCLVCRKKYEYCPKCGRGDWSKKYMFVYCSENCYEIDKVLMDYRSDYNLITNEEAKEKLLKFDLSQKENYPPLIKKDVDEILAYEVEKKELITDVSCEDIEVKQDEIKQVPNDGSKKSRTSRKRTSRRTVSSEQNISE